MTARWYERYQTWMEWFQRAGVLAVGMGLVSLRRSGSDAVTVLAEDVRQAVAQPVGDTIERWLRHARWLRDHDDRQLLATVLHSAPDLVLSVQSLTSESGWTPALTEVRQSSGARWQLEVDDAVSALIAGCRGQLPVGLLLDLLWAAAPDETPADAAQTVRYLIQRDVLSPFPA